MPLAGRQISIGWSLALCKHVGFKENKLVTAVCVMCAESGRYTNAWHDNLNPAGGVSSTDHGLFQINDFWHPDLKEDNWYRAIPNAKTACEMSGAGKHWSPWAAFKSGAYLQFHEDVTLVMQLGKWRGRVEQIPARALWWDSVGEGLGK